jgi:hypothetical protein
MMSSSRRRREEDEDVLVLRELDSQVTWLMVLALMGLGLLIYAVVRLAQVVNMSLDQQEDLSDRLSDARQALDVSRAAGAPASSPSGATKT